MGRDAFEVLLEAVAIQLPHSTQYWLSKDVMMSTVRQHRTTRRRSSVKRTTGLQPDRQLLASFHFSSLNSLWKKQFSINIMFIQQDCELGLPCFNVDMFCHKKYFTFGTYRYTSSSALKIIDITLIFQMRRMLTELTGSWASGTSFDIIRIPSYIT